MPQDFNKGFGSCHEPVTRTEPSAEEAAALDAEGSLDAEDSLDQEYAVEQELPLSPEELEARRVSRLRAAREFNLDMELAKLTRGFAKKPGSWVKTSSPLIK